MLRAVEKRDLADNAFYFALAGDFRSASGMRQQAYSFSPPGTIGLDWSNSEEVWENDKRELDKILSYDCSDLKNSAAFTSSLKAAYFVDVVLFGFRDWYTVRKFAAESPERICCPAMEKYLHETGFDIDSVSRIVVYVDTMHQNILGFSPFPKGKYNLGFPPDAPQFIIDGRRKWLKTYDAFTKMQAAQVPGFPKTYKTFENHLRKNDEKYQAWVRAYEEIKKVPAEPET